MFRNRFILMIGTLALLVAGMAASYSRSHLAAVTEQGASDFHQRHPDWQWLVSNQKAIIPLTGDGAFPDYYRRHPELSVPAGASVDTTDYYFRHPGLGASGKSGDLTDYFFRHPELRGESTRTGDMTDYYFRHSGN